MPGEKTYIVIDLKSFYASVECMERGLDPMTTNLVVADPDRSKGTICLAISPAMKKLGVKNRCKEIPELAAVFNRQNEKTTTFMEAVCQIRQKSSERNSKKPELNSSSFRSLTSLHLSLDLSRLSIGKDLNF